jgi:hypothetical protein
MGNKITLDHMLVGRGNDDWSVAKKLKEKVLG